MAKYNHETERSKTRARAIMARLSSLGIEAGLQKAYEVLAAADGHRSWAAMKASLADMDTSQIEASGTRGLDLWASDQQVLPTFPALLAGGTRTDRAAAVRRVAETLCMDIVELQCDARSIAVFSAEIKERDLQEHKRPIIVYVEQRGQLLDAAEKVLCRWMDDGRFSVVIGAGKASDVSTPMLRRFARRTMLHGKSGAVPNTIIPNRYGVITIFGGSTQAAVNESLVEYAATFVERSLGIVMGDPAFEEVIAARFPARSTIIEATKAMSEGGNDFHLMMAALKNEYDHIWVQDFERYRFHEYEKARKSSMGALEAAFEIGHCVCGGMIAGSPRELFERTAATFPHLVWLMNSEYSRHHRDGRLKVRVAFKGEDLSEDFSNWAKENDATHEERFMVSRTELWSYETRP